jgi:RIO kinase 1
MVSKDEKQRFLGDMYKTLKDVFDLFTEGKLFKLIKQGYFEGLESPISIGKESNVFTALQKDNKRVIVKIYRLQTCDFNRMYDYIKADPRFPNVKHYKRKIIFAWTQREYRNLLKAREAGVRCPTPYVFNNNILVMEYIGDEEGPASMLKDNPPKDPKDFFKQTMLQLKKLLKIKMVHGDLSAFNILNYNEKPVLIDMSQASTLDNPNAMSYLKRDIKNICIYFAKQGVRKDPEEEFEKLTKSLKETVKRR